MIQKIEKYFRNPEFRKYLKPKLVKYWGSFDMKPNEVQKIVQSFSKSMEENFRPIPESWTTLTLNSAWEYLSDHIGSHNTLKSYIEKGWLASKDGQPYKQELDMLKAGLDAAQFAIDKGFMSTQKEGGQTKIVLWPEKVSKLKLHPMDQKMRGFFKMFKEKWFEDWADFTDTDTL